MNNSFTDFFETLLPREFSIYVVPGSIALVAIDLYFLKADASPLRNFFQGTSTFQAHEFLFGTLLWFALAYAVGLAIGACTEALHLYQKTKRCKNGKIRPVDIDRKIRLGRQAMYVALHEQMMYRREIERYGVMVRAMDNCAIAVTFWAFLELINGVPTSWGLLFLLLILIPIFHYGARGYKHLQSFRVETLFWATFNAQNSKPMTIQGEPRQETKAISER